MSVIYYSKDYNKDFLDKLKQEIKRVFAGCKTIAIKIHFGEPGNDFAFKPEQIRPITDLLRELNIDFFFFDSPVAYESIRKTPEGQIRVAHEKGWDKLGMIKSSNDYVEVKGKNMVYQVCKDLIEADGVLVISHVKGHVCTGFGGAIKNLGMGALTKETKAAIHEGGEPVLVGDCVKCGTCVAMCPINGIRLDDEHEGPVFEQCYGCSNCSYVCPEKALKPKVNYFDVLLAEGAFSAQSRFKRVYYISSLNNITKECDCESDPKGLIARDYGFLFGNDGVAIDKAAYDIITKNEGDVFLKYNKKTGLKQIEAAESFGMGSSEYELVTL